MFLDNAIRFFSNWSLEINITDARGDLAISWECERNLGRKYMGPFDFDWPRQPGVCEGMANHSTTKTRDHRVIAMCALTTW